MSNIQGAFNRLLMEGQGMLRLAKNMSTPKIENMPDLPSIDEIKKTNETPVPEVPTTPATPTTPEVKSEPTEKRSTSRKQQLQKKMEDKALDIYLITNNSRLAMKQNIKARKEFLKRKGGKK